MSSFLSFLAKKKFPNGTVRAELFSGPFTALQALAYVLCIAILIIAYGIVIGFNNRFLVTVPAHGGELTEGIIGSPRFINPVLAATENDTALVHLVYAGLMKETRDGSIVPELAQSYEVSPDGRVYTVTLRRKLFFHDATPVTSSDVAFTIEKLQDPDINTRNAPYWQNVSVDTPDQHTIVLSLLTPDPQFLKKITVGILPMSRWQGVSDDAFVDPTLNTQPIGAGPYRFKSAQYDTSGALKLLVFERNKSYALGNPYLAQLRLAVFANQNALVDALNAGKIDITFAINPATLTKETMLAAPIRTVPIPTPIDTEIVRQKTEPVFQDSAFLSVIDRFIDKTKIVAIVENGYGVVESNPPASVEETITALSKLGYTYTDGVLRKKTTPVTFSIATKNEPEYIAVSRTITEQLRTIGIHTQTAIFTQGPFQDGIDQSYFPIVLASSDTSLPPSYARALGLYKKTVLLVAQKSANGISYHSLSGADKRYATVERWFTKTNRVWKWFAKK